MVKIETLYNLLTCKVYTDLAKRTLYATDASDYKEMPLAVVFPENQNDIIELIKFTRQNNLSLIPRGGGTSLAGQVVGKGIVVDVSKHLNNIIEINETEKTVKVQPGVVLTELNRILVNKKLFFGPETSSGNRVTIGGMVGNNATGSHSLFYGDTRSKLKSVKAVLSDGNTAEFGEISKTDFIEKLKLQNVEGDIYRKFNEILSSENNKKTITDNFPNANVKRRNTGYALDFLIDNEIFGNSSNKLNVAKLLAGSEGTLAFLTEITLILDPIPPKHVCLVCVHFGKLQDAFRANLVALKYKPVAVELMDKTILVLTKDNIEQRKNRYFVEGEPEAILIVEFVGENKDEIIKTAQALEKEMRANNFGYSFPNIWDEDTKKVWNLRKAGLGVLSNVQGDARPVSLVEDTAVDVNVLPEYLDEFDQIMKKYGLSCVYHAHIGSGELHLRPLLNLKNSKDVELFRTIAYEVALLVKKYRGSLSGEHGDGRLRGEFIPLLFGEVVYNFFKQVKFAFDPQNIFNPGKIIDTPPMNTSLRYSPDNKNPEIETIYYFSKTKDFFKAVEKCNGSGDCRKSEFAGGTMCPSFQATQNEWNSTRARANTLREFISNSKKFDVFDYQEVYDILDTCLSCKACKSECPSNVDMTKLKAEFLNQFYQTHFIPLRSILVANFPKLNRVLSVAPKFSNFMMNSAFGKIFSTSIGFAKQRSIPELQKPLSKQVKKLNLSQNTKIIYFLNDEFTNFNDSDIGFKAIVLLEKLGYKVVIPKYIESGRTYLSKGLITKAKKIINKNILFLKDIITENTPLIGIEPSTILTFRDESLDLAEADLKPAAQQLAKNCFMIDEFIAKEIEVGKIKAEQFTNKSLKIKLHGHCYQKALCSTQPTIKMLSLPVNYKVEEIKSGCCGMAGSFGYEKEHYDLSMKVGELVLFPAVRNSDSETEIVAPGTSCRHQIEHGTGKKAKHPIEILYEAVL